MINASTQAGSPDQAADYMRVFFGGNLTDPCWYVEECLQTFGPKPGRASIVIASTKGVIDEAANQVVLNKSGPAGSIKIGDICQIYGVSTQGNTTNEGTIFFGKVTSLDHDKDRDAIVVTAQDPRHLMRENGVAGRWITDGQDLHYQQGWNAHYNPGGRPNCMIDQNGNLCFAPYPEFGLEDNEDVPDEPEVSRTAYWTVARIATYLVQFFGPSPIVDYPSEFKSVPTADARYIKWELNWASNIDEEPGGVGQGNQNIGGRRKGREMILEGMTLLDALQELLSKAGGWTFGMIPVGNKPMMEIKAFDGRYVEGGCDLPHAVAGTPKATAEMTGGNYIEEGEDHITNMTGRSQLVMIEQRLTDDPAEAVADRGLLEAWDSTREVNQFNPPGWLKTIIDRGNDDQGYREANSIFPEVMTTWRLRADHDFLSGTEFNGFPRAPIVRPPWPTQLSFMSSKTASEDFAGLRWPIYIEVKIDNDFVVADRFDGLAVLENGVFIIPSLRELSAPIQVIDGEPFAQTPFTVKDEKAVINNRPIRTNLAIPCDFGITAAFAVGDDDTTADYNFAKIQASPDSDRIAAGHKRGKWVDLQQLYARQLTNKSFPEAQSAGGVQEAQGDIRNDDDLIKSHVRRMLTFESSLGKGGRPRFDGHIVRTYQLGTKIKNFTSSISDFPCRAVIHGIRWFSQEGSPNAVGTELIFNNVTTFNPS